MKAAGVWSGIHYPGSSPGVRGPLPAFFPAIGRYQNSSKLRDLGAHCVAPILLAMSRSVEQDDNNLFLDFSRGMSSGPSLTATNSSIMTGKTRTRNDRNEATESMQEAHCAAHKDTSEAITLALQQLQATQSPDGSWRGDYGGPGFLLPTLVAATRIIDQPFDADIEPDLALGSWWCNPCAALGKIHSRSTQSVRLRRRDARASRALALAGGAVCASIPLLVSQPHGLSAHELSLRHPGSGVVVTAPVRASPGDFLRAL